MSWRDWITSRLRPKPPREDYQLMQPGSLIGWPEIDYWRGFHDTGTIAVHDKLHCPHCQKKPTAEDIQRIRDDL